MYRNNEFLPQVTLTTGKGSTIIAQLPIQLNLPLTDNDLLPDILISSRKFTKP